MAMKHTNKPRWLINAERRMTELEDLEINLIDTIESSGVISFSEHRLYNEYKRIEKEAREAESTFKKLYAAWDNYHGICIHSNRIPEFLEAVKNSTERVPEWAQ